MSFIILAISYIFGWVFPPAFLPVQISLMGNLLLEGYSPWTVALFATIVSTLSYVPLWIIIDILFKKLQKTHTEKTDQELQEDIVDSKYAEKENLVYTFVKRTLSSAQYKKFSTFMDSKTGKRVTFGIAVFLCAPIASDIIAVLLLRGKMSLKLFLVAGLIAKALTIFPIVFLGEGLITHFINNFSYLWAF